MSNPVRRGVLIQLDRPRTLLFTLTSLVRLEETLGQNVLEDDFWKNLKMTLKEVRVLVWSALLHEDPELTLEEAGNLVEIHRMGEVVEALSLAYEKSNAEAEAPAPSQGDQSEIESPLVSSRAS